MVSHLISPHLTSSHLQEFDSWEPWEHLAHEPKMKRYLSAWGIQRPTPAGASPGPKSEPEPTPKARHAAETCSESQGRQGGHRTRGGRWVSSLKGAAAGGASGAAGGAAGGAQGGSSSCSTDAGALSALPAAPSATTGTVIEVCCVQRVATPVAGDGVPNLTVEVQKHRMLVTEALAQALTLGDSGNLVAARTLLQTSMDALQSSASFMSGNSDCLSLGEDLADGLVKLRDERAYHQTGGRAEITEMCGKGGAQRMIYGKGGKSTAYQSVASRAGQTRAAASKSARK